MKITKLQFLVFTWVKCWIQCYYMYACRCTPKIFVTIKLILWYSISLKFINLCHAHIFPINKYHRYLYTKSRQRKTPEKMEIFEKKFWKLLTLFWFRYYLMNFETELKNGKPRKKRQQYQGKKVGWLHFVFAWTKTERVAHIFFPSKLSCFVFFFCFFHIWFLDDVKTKTTKKKLLKCCENSFTMSFIKKTFFFILLDYFTLLILDAREYKAAGIS